VQSEELQAQSEELHKAYQTLRESEEKYRNIVETANEGIWIIGADLRTTYVNEKMAEMLGYTREEMIGKYGRDFADKENKALIKLHLDKRKHGTHETYELKLLSKDGSTLWMLSSSRSLFDEDGKFAGSLAMLTDITERKKAEEGREQLLGAIQQEKDRLAALINSITDEVWFADNQKKISLVNPAVLNEFGSSIFDNAEVEAIAGSSEVYRPDGTPRPVEEAPPLRALKGEIIRNQGEIVRTPSSGELRFRQVNSAPVRDTGGNVIGSVSVVRDITELKKAEEALSRKEEEFRTLVENSPDVIARFDRQNRHIYVNPAAVEPYGCSQEEIIGKTLDELGIDPEIAKLCERHYENVFATSKPEIMEFQHTSPQGKKYYFNTRIVPEFVNGKVTSVLAISRDITDIKEAEAKLKEAHDSLEERVKERTAELEKSYNSLLENEIRLNEAQKIAHLGNWDWDLVTDKLYWSNEVYRIFGLDRLELAPAYNEFLNYVHPDDRGYVDNVIKEAILNGRPCEVDYRIILADEGERIVHLQGEIIFNEENIPIRMRGTVQDITERMKAEEALRQSEASLRRFYDSGMFGVFYYNLNGSVTDANDTFLEMIGYTREDLQAGLIQWDKMTPPEYRSLDEYAIAELKATGMDTPYEKEFIRKDGSRIPIFLGAATIDEARNEGVVFVLDITERKKAAKALEKIEKIRMKEIHHRIKNNLQVISSLLDLQSEIFEDEMVKKAFREGQNRVISMALIHEELYKGEGTDTLDFSAYIQKLAESLFHTYSLRSKNIRLYTDFEEDTFLDMDTAVPLGIIVNELISNSLKHAFTEKQEGEIRIQLCRDEEVSKEMRKSIFDMTISDNGEGIPEDLELENAESLGLQLVSILVDQLDGEIELEKNNGTAFTIRFAVTEKDNQASVPDPQLFE
jgi:PAS domain S-box-containing protein